jgi:AraC family transcriptional regulator, transcriptional activator of pobA
MPKINWENAYSLIDPQINAEGLHVWPFDPAFPLDVRFYVWDKRHHIRMNRHDYFELFYLQSGELTCRIQDREFSMHKGDLAVISSMQYHTMLWPTTSKSSSQIKVATLYFMPDLIRATDATGEDVEYLMPFLLQDANFAHVVKSDTGLPAQVFDLINRMQTDLPAQSTRARLTVKTYLKMILVYLVNYYADQQGTVETFNRKQRALDQLRPLFNFLEANFGEQILVTNAAEMVNMSPSHFMRFFKQVTGQSFISYLNHFRIAKAELLLATTDLSVSEVSQAVGFCDQSYFGLVFRRFAKMTPAQYKKIYASSQG